MNRPGGFLRRAPRRTFRDRREAGRVLAEELAAYHDKDGLLVLGLARGGVPVGWEVAAALHAELDVFLVRKLGVPNWSELAMGALASGGGVVMNDNVVSSLRIGDDQVRAIIDRETIELDRRERAYRRGRPVADPRDKTVILVDDGIATGASMLAGVRALRASNPQSIVGSAVSLPGAGAGGRRRGVRDHAQRLRGGGTGFRRLPSGHRRRGP
jgi:putative phosphoribosyl transferase